MKYSEISHFSHPHHNLKFEYAEAPFKCDGCKEVGIGSSYKCGGAACNFDLHTHCAVPSPSITHPFYTKCSFQFLSRPPGQEARYCNACEKSVTGSCTTASCAGLISTLAARSCRWCWTTATSNCTCSAKCGRKGRSWSYRSSCKKYNLHVACVKEMLVDSWQELYNGSGGYTYTGGRKSVPSLKATLETHSNHKKSSKGKARKCCEVAGLALQFVVSALLGSHHPYCRPRRHINV
ncbi:UNVERIFIED_CONTAM: hypothetical protein Sangu_1066600 [Sesamum angustifolium]|uniref:DC1 domain-containing protein n=1 Tax=Sesamum angustifolium TaxID=2727405 RepID=A0AAW2NYM2_9LAMI